MHPLTSRFLTKLWKGNPTFQTISKRILSLSESLSPLEATYIGRDILIRRSKLFTTEFKQAAFLASDGMAGNDGFLDFSDCAALLPEDRFEKILANHDALIDDPISSEFDEFYLITQITNIVDNILAGEDHCHILHDLVIGDQPDEEERTITAEEAKKLFPRIFKKYGHLMESKQTPTMRSSRNSTGLSDFILDHNLREQLGLDE